MPKTLSNQRKSPKNGYIRNNCTQGTPTIPQKNQFLAAAKSPKTSLSPKNDFNAPNFDYHSKKDKSYHKESFMRPNRKKSSKNGE